VSEELVRRRVSGGTVIHLLTAAQAERKYGKAICGAAPYAWNEGLEATRPTRICQVCDKLARLREMKGGGP
jgi:hypothetical protein